MQKRIFACAAVALAAASVASGQTFTQVVRDDVAYGLNRNNPIETTQLVRGTPIGTRQTNEWGVNFMQSMQFDNVNGFAHNPVGNLVGVNFGTTTAGGSIFSLQTAAGTNPGASTSIFDFATYNAANPASPLTVSRLGGLSFSPDNSKLAVGGNDGGIVYVFDYSAGNGTGNGTALTNGKQFAGAVATGSTVGTAWLNNNTLLVTDNAGALKSIDVGTGSVNTIANLPTTVTTSFFSSVAYEPTISPNAYVMLSGLNAGVTVNQLYVVDVATGSIVTSKDYSLSMNTGRELSFNSRGDLIVGQFGNTTSTPLGGSIEIIANAWNPSALADNVSSKYYIQEQTNAFAAQFSGLDAASKMLDYVNTGVTTDLGNGSHEQQYFGPSAPLSQLRSKLAIGYAGGSWNGVGGILSSTAASTPIADGIGYGEGGTVIPLFGGVGTFVVRYTLLGDANLNGTVNIADFSTLAANFNQPGFWTNGDFNYDGIVNIGDFSLLASNFNQSVPGSTARGVVPEPASFALAGLGALLIARRRR